MKDLNGNEVTVVGERGEERIAYEHKINGVLGAKGAYGVTHDWDCPACVEAHRERMARHVNPHRPGTKAHDEWVRMNNRAAMGSDPRTETYWSM